MIEAFETVLEAERRAARRVPTKLRRDYLPVGCSGAYDTGAVEVSDWTLTDTFCFLRATSACILRPLDRSKSNGACSERRTRDRINGDPNDLMA